MISRPRIQLLVAVLLFVVCLGGCDRVSRLFSNDDRFFGKWTFDRDYTQAHLPKEAMEPPSTPTPPNGASADAKGTTAPINEDFGAGLKAMLVATLIKQAEEQSFTITPKLITDSSGQTRTYQVIERPTPNDMSVKMSDGTIWTVTIEDGRIFLPTTGSVHFKLYFKRSAR